MWNLIQSSGTNFLLLLNVVIIILWLNYGTAGAIQRYTTHILSLKCFYDSQTNINLSRWLPFSLVGAKLKDSQRWTKFWAWDASQCAEITIWDIYKLLEQFQRKVQCSVAPRFAIYNHFIYPITWLTQSRIVDISTACHWVSSINFHVKIFSFPMGDKVVGHQRVSARTQRFSNRVRFGERRCLIPRTHFWILNTCPVSTVPSSYYCPW